MWTILKQQIWRWRGVLITVPTVAGGLLLLRLTGALQLMELVALDQMFRLRPAEPVDARIVLVTIDESDVKQLAQWPMSDAVLAQLITSIKQQQPSVIGLDIFRDLPVEPGQQALANVFTTTPNLIGIENVIKAGNGEIIPAPPLLKQRDQVSASDLLLDKDGRVRRSLLYLRTQDDRSIFTLGARLAFFYLDKQGIYRQSLNPEQTNFRLGRAVFTPLQPDEGGYVGMDAGGYQILANFPKFPPGFHTVSLTDVLQGRLPHDLLRDRIVLIGVTAESLKDKFFTSYTTDSTAVPAGVEVHALLTSQLLSAALNGRSLLHTWSEPMECLWIVVWSTVGAIIGWTASSPRQTVLKVVLLGITLGGGAYILFLMGWWIITVPPLLALAGSAIMSNSYLLWENLKEYARTLEQKVEERTLNLEQEIVERKQAEATLSQQKQLLQTIVDHIPVMITLYDATGHIEFVNHQFEKVLGWSAADVQNIDLVAECSSDSEQRQQILDHMLAAKGTWLDLKIRTKDDRLVNTAWANVQLNNHLFVGIGQDISDRKRAEEASILDERNRMAREIHDTLAQAFTGILLHVGAATEQLIKKPATAQTHLETVDELARSGLAEARRSVTALRPKLLEEGNLFDALKHLTNQMKLSANTQITCEIIGAAYTLAPNVENHLLRIGQEALTNAVKYAHASQINVELICEDSQCLLRVKDNGQGFDIDQVSLSKGFGLLGMSERVEQIGGELVIQSHPGQGTEIVVVVSRE
ncbi:CHASE2 domain-containing protein (plasmid) [Kovacikia minuta CCNUW1]|uniref:CHASE2 domain-containing protein n=1 Tax=Kovacikia minuta TaxID=2931930 RepID=UPI001CC9DAF5|nr:CHASE2 domain-containing protein [Kovacikia minuta]UBF30379.1 CHASE2 domain-containing protein [Kovacikia minuta CCNUW1]